MKHGRFALVAALACAAWLPSAQAQQQDKLCVDQACLGMTLEQAQALPLEAAGMFGFSLTGNGEFYGLNQAGQRIAYAEAGDFDGALIKKFTASVATICRFGGANAKMTGSNGKRVILSFRPAIREGKSELVLAEISSTLPKTLSEADVQRIKAEASKQYGAAFSASWSDKITTPTMALHQHRLAGNALTLRLPEDDASARLLAQPGCASKG